MIFDAAYWQTSVLLILVPFVEGTHLDSLPYTLTNESSYLYLRSLHLDFDPSILICSLLEPVLPI